jgi:hypothetical protein
MVACTFDIGKHAVASQADFVTAVTYDRNFLNGEKVLKLLCSSLTRLTNCLECLCKKKPSLLFASDSRSQIYG